MAGHQVTDFARRLRISRAVSGRASEYCRLAEIRCSKCAVSTSCMALVCIELASVRLGEPFDKKQAVKLSGLQSNSYLNWYRTIEKMLGLSMQLGPKELGIRLGCLEAVELAKEVLHAYKGRMQQNYSEERMKDLDLDGPLYTAAALYYSCKLLKIGCDKEKFLSSASSNRSMFQKVLDEMKKCPPENLDHFKKGKKKLTKEKESASSKAVRQTKSSSAHPVKRARMRTLLSRVLSDPTSQEYLQWKERTIQQAKEELALNVEQ